MIKETAVNGPSFVSRCGGGHGGAWISTSGGSAGSSSFGIKSLEVDTRKGVSVPYWEKRVKQIGKGKRHYFYIDKMWHYIELDEVLPPLIHYNVRITKSPA